MNIWVRDFHLVQEEIQKGVEIGVGIEGEDRRKHVEDAAHGGARDSHGGEALFDGFEVRDWGRSKVRVFLEGFLGVHIEVLEVDDFFPENEASVGG